jgi:hypothetical protein
MQANGIQQMIKNQKFLNADVNTHQFSLNNQAASQRAMQSTHQLVQQLQCGGLFDRRTGALRDWPTHHLI